MSTLPSPSMPAPGQLQAALTHALPNFHQIDWVQSTLSTNADLMARARSSDGPLARPWLLGAHLQERGRGRAGRSWQNRAGANLMFSCAFDVFLPSQRLPALSPLAGLAACEALRRLIQPTLRNQLSMKWPNDIQWGLAKLAGILVEVTRAGTSRLSADHYVAVIGMGINLNDARALSQSLDRQVADWSEITREDAHAAAVDAVDIVAGIANAWYTSLNDVTARGFAGLPERYAEVDILAGQHINVLDEGRLTHAGIACGVNDLGQLLVRTHTGETPISVGDISVRAQGARP
ncbi:biotin--[acetyl-CoA-carboxylase] ligase [Pollutimonas subterranea]|uniref:biotin--[biotin carboxyl-carrier protein] ligase n=1 Tax=Pollutimonas subterranea TaxID=2045210 RepID=A0A2N4U2Z2_9BURK|nr:biotin--[acetyl-CoA-carboxylase] ligase [Pollutimonas subterranea]PLC49394.1 biotin--[acetyl-CoA-carboxylase] ligase [Pollutimonas subterranea]